MNLSFYCAQEWERDYNMKIYDKNSQIICNVRRGKGLRDVE